MSGLVIALRLVPLVALAAAALLSSRRGRSARSRARSGGRAPLVANFAAFGAYLSALLVFSASSTGPAAFRLASSGALLAVAGVALVLRSRGELGPAWSFVPSAD